MSGAIAKNSFWASVVNYTGSVIGLLSTFFLFPLVFSPAENGVFRLYIEMGALLAGVGQLGTGYSIWKFFPQFKNENNGHNGIGFWITVIPLIGIFIVCLFLAFGKPWVIEFLGEKGKSFLPYYNLLYPFVFFFVFNTVYEVFSAALGKIVFASFLRENVVRIGLAVLGFLYYQNHLDFWGCMLGVAVVYATVCLLNVLSVSSTTTVDYRPHWNFINQSSGLKREFLGYTGYLFLTYVAMLVLQRMDFLMVTKIQGMSDTGVYGIALSMSVLIEIPTRSILQIANPKLSEALHEKNHVEVKRLYEKTSLNQFVLGAMVLLLIWINIDAFFSVMPNGELYLSGKYAVLFLGIGKLFVLLQGNSSAMLIFSKRYYYTLIVNVVAIFAAVYMNQWLIPIMGLNGAAMATGLVWLVSGAVLGVLVWQVYGMHPINKNVVLSILIMALFIGVSEYFRPFPNQPILSAIIANLVLLPACLLVIFKLRISEDIISMITKLIGRFRR